MWGGATGVGQSVSSHALSVAFLHAVLKNLPVSQNVQAWHVGGGEVPLHRHGLDDVQSPVFDPSSLNIRLLNPWKQYFGRVAIEVFMSSEAGPKYKFSCAAALVHRSVPTLA